MVFWRSKNPQTSKPAGADDTAGEAAAEDSEATSDSSAERGSPDADNVVPLIAQKLTDRLADRVKGTSEPSTEGAASGDDESASSTLPVKRRVVSREVEPATAGGRGLSQSARRETTGRRVDGLQKAIYAAKPGRHIIAVADPSEDCRGEVRRLAEIRAQALEAARDWIYILDPGNAGRLLTFAVPPGDGPRFVRDVNAAIEKAASMFARLMASDAYRLSLDLIEEDTRQSVDKLLENVRLRADSQNIAVIRSLDGYVLAPMHDGKVVRPEVFRALPERLRKDVEGKVKELEKDLQAIVAALPEAEVEADDKLQGLIEQTAIRAVKPTLGVLRKVYGTKADYEAIFERLEQAFVRAALTTARRNPDAAGGIPVLCWTTAGGANGEPASDGAPVVVLRSVEPRDLCGEIGHNALGALALRPGDLMRGNGGIVIVEAWRLVADPRGWAALSAILDRGTLVPCSAPGLAVQAQPIPLSLTLILITDPLALEGLERLDPGCGQYFAAVTSAGDSAALGEAAS